ncbi:hypothetical protein [Flavobacterium sp. HJSW_4]|uniref:hypothetical protein n=1 Tax=Flavobacterium sp. HJSW_4 TaxID=3344660 RepID=UPI0035F43A99
MKKQLGNNYYNIISEDLDGEIYDLLLTDVNAALFDYSDHHKSNKLPLKSKFKQFLINRLFVGFYLLNKLKKRYTGEMIILSNAYIPLNVPNSVTLLPPWIFSPKKKSFANWKIILIINQLKFILKERSIKLLLSENFKFLVDKFELELGNLFVKFKLSAVVVPNDMAFFEKLALRVAKKKDIPSFVCLHGLPARYNDIDDNRADYLIVWGKGIKELYIDAGVKEDKILTFKHPVYSSFSALELQSNLSNVLVLSRATCGIPCESSQLILTDRSTTLHYTELVKENLKKLGVNKATLRLHPSENEDFYLKNLPDDFFTIDRSSKDDALNQCSLVIGPTSTMVLDAIKMGKNYILFDPVFNGLTLEGMPLVSPFTGESFIKLSNSLEEMKYNINNPNDNISYHELNNFLSIDSNDEEKFLGIMNKNK